MINLNVLDEEKQGDHFTIIVKSKVKNLNEIVNDVVLVYSENYRCFVSITHSIALTKKIYKIKFKLTDTFYVE